MKKMLLLFTLLMPLVLLAEEWKDPETGITWRYIIKDGVASVGDGSHAASPARGSIEIPAVLGGCPVTGINRYAFNSCSKLTAITIPSGVKNIGPEAFRMCNALTYVEIPLGVETIGEMAFCECTSLLAISIPSSVYEIEDYAFHYCRSMTEVIISDGVNVIGSYAFNSCQSLLSVTIPPSVEIIGENAFSDCFNLSIVNIAKGDRSRVKSLLEESGLDTQSLKFVASGESIPDIGSDVSADAFEKKMTFNGLVYASDVMCGMIQITTDKKTAKGVKVSGFVILEDGKKQAMKATVAQVSERYLKVNTTVGKLGSLNLTIGDNCFLGTLGDMTVATADVDENTGIVSASVKVQYFDAKTGKLKSKSYKLTGVTFNGEAVGNISLKSDTKSFEAIIE